MQYYTCESLLRPEVIRWHSRIKNRYSPPDYKKVAVFLPCSAKKPYSTSKSHRAFIRAIKSGAKSKYNLVHQVIITSPLGLVPRELEQLYPACCYDTTVTGYWSHEEREAVKELIRSYLSKFGGRAIGYASEAYAEILSEMGIPVVNVDNLLAEESLRKLENAIEEIVMEHRHVKSDDSLTMLRKIADFQFGSGIGEEMFKSGVKLRKNRIYKNGEYARLHPDYGYIIPTLKSAQVLAERGAYTVEINFRPETKSVFCSGVERASREIVPGDEVAIVYKGELVAVGRAVLSGRDMERASRGVAVKLREIAK